MLDSQNGYTRDGTPLRLSVDVTFRITSFNFLRGICHKRTKTATESVCKRYVYNTSHNKVMRGILESLCPCVLVLSRRYVPSC